MSFLSPEYENFLEALKTKVYESRYQAARYVNKELILLYHHIGTEILKRQKQQGWSAKVIDQLSQDLTKTFPEMKGFSSRNLKYMRLFAETYVDSDFVQEVLAQLSWYHHLTLLDKVKEESARLFYIQQTLEYGWSRNRMVMQIEQNLYHRQGKSITDFSYKLPSPHSDLAQQTLKNPYFFDFLSLGKEAHEREIEKELVKHIEKFLLTLGAGFAFVGRQYPLEIAEQDFYLDLLFYHLKLRSFVVIELKDGAFKPEYAGKMNFYLSAVDNLLKHPSDNPSMGLILCKSQNDVLAEYTLPDMTTPIGLAEYRLHDVLPEEIKTALPTIEELEAELSKELDIDNDER